MWLERHADTFLNWPTRLLQCDVDLPIRIKTVIWVRRRPLMTRQTESKIILTSYFIYINVTNLISHTCHIQTEYSSFINSSNLLIPYKKIILNLWVRTPLDLKFKKRESVYPPARNNKISEWVFQTGNIWSGTVAHTYVCMHISLCTAMYIGGFTVYGCGTQFRVQNSYDKLHKQLWICKI